MGIIKRKMRTIEPEFVKVVLNASREAFLDFIENKDCFVGLPSRNDTSTTFSVNSRITTKEFDEASYRIFLAGLKFVKDKDIIMKITERIGQKIFAYFTKHDKFLLTGNPNDIKSWQSDLEKLVKCLIHIGYLEDGKIIWKGDEEFLYQMKDPVILLSATKLFNKYGIAQHYSSRTIETLFSTYRIKARENPDFNPNKYSKDLVIEHWTIAKF